LNKAKERLSFCSVLEFLEILEGHQQSKGGRNLTNLLDLSDESNPLDLQNYKRSLNYNKMINLLEIMSLSNLYPGVSFEIFPLSKIKIASVDLSQLLINKPIPPTNKLKTFQYGYLSIDERNRLRPIDTNSSENTSCIGVWVYGLDIPSYKVESDQNMCMQSDASNSVNRENAKAQLLNNPYLWLTCTKFMHDERIEKRLSASSKDSFVIVHFFNNTASPQFLEFRMMGTLNRHPRNSEALNIKSPPPKFITLNEVNPKSQELVKLEDMSYPGSLNVIDGTSEQM
jgi:hypothetical protein